VAERSLRFDLIARDKSFSRTLDQMGRKGERLNRQLARSMGETGDRGGAMFSTRLHKRLGGGFSASAKLARVAAGSIAGAFAAVSVAGFLKDAIDEAREAAKVGRQTAAVIKATGGAANVSAKDVDRLASSLMRTVAVDDEIIATGANMLLTFRNVRNEVGKGNNIFDQATVAALDMTAAMNQGEVTQEGLQASTIRLGKALNDPIKGMTALQRVGVTFTQGQRDQIKALVEAGRTMDAQKLILAELKAEFGGAARAAVDPWQRVKVVLGELKEQIGTALLPVLAKVAEWLSRTLPAAFDRLKESLRVIKQWWDDNKTSVQLLGETLNTFFSPALASTKKNTDDLLTSTQKLQLMLNSMLEFVLRVSQGFIALARVTGNVSLRVLDLIVVVGKAINAVDRLSGGSGHAADSMIDWARDMRDQTRVQLGKLEQDAKDTQAAIDRMHGKNIEITGALKLNFSPSFTQKDWVQVRMAAGRMAAGGRVTNGTGPTADDVLVRVSKGETIVPAHLTPEIAPWAASRGIPGFRAGGFVGQIDSQTRAVNKVQARGTGSLLDKGLTKLLSAFGSGKPEVVAFIRSTDPLPYVWGAAGPFGYDCSGLVSAVLGKHTGAGGGHGQRYFTTSSIHSGILGIKPGLGGVLEIGVTAGTGHMAGRYGGRRGLGFEAESSRTGIKIGSAASSPESFARHFHLARGGRVDQEMVARFAALAGLDIGGDAGRMRINGKVLDRGGWLMPGTTLATNRTGRPEPVGFPNVQITVNVSGVVSTNPRDLADQLVPAIRSGLKQSLRRDGKTQLANLL
jgi:hypothetical protein